VTLPVLIAESWWASGPGGHSGGNPPAARPRSGAEDAAATPNDHAIAARIRAGDVATFDALVLETFPILTRVAARLTGSITDGEEIAQDVLFRLWMRRDTLRPATTLTVYLLAAVRNRALNWVRDHRTAARHLATGMIPVPSPPPSPDAGPVEDERRRRVTQALEALVPRHRLAVELRYGAQASFAEVGAALGVSDRAAEQILRRAVLALRRTLGEDL
jgi:RNA polymerase sigma-70 factor (ECF subfamily)